MRCKECGRPTSLGIPVKEVPPYGPIQEFTLCPMCFSSKIRAEIEKYKRRENDVAAFINAFIPPGVAPKKSSSLPHQP